MRFEVKLSRILLRLYKQHDVRSIEYIGNPLATWVSRNFHNSTPKMDDLSLSLLSTQLAPPLDQHRHKGQAGRVGIFGGSLEYTGAPYFAAISALKVGADLVHVFCARDAATVIKSYSPELIVHPLLDVEDAVSKIEPWLDRLHVLIIGPGLGREPGTFAVIEEIFRIGKGLRKPFVIDADGLFLLAEKPQILDHFPPPGAIITPNVAEFGRIFGSSEEADVTEKLKRWGNHVTVLRKGEEDLVLDYAKKIPLKLGGSGRRCGGQGDILSGALGVFYSWALQHKLDVCVSHDDRAMIACYAACKLTRECNANAFKKLGRSMTASDMIGEIHGVFDKYFEAK